MKNKKFHLLLGYDTGFTLKWALVIVLLVALLAPVVAALFQWTTRTNQANLLTTQSIPDTNNSKVPQWTCTQDKICTTVTYDKRGNMTKITCSIDKNGACEDVLEDAIYDEAGHLIAIRDCEAVSNEGVCSSYGDGKGYSDWNEASADYKYDADGNRIALRYCEKVAKDGTCAEYGKEGHFDYTYDANGNKLAKLYCNSLADDGMCRAYGTSAEDDNCFHLSEYYTYDAHRNLISMRTCRTVAENGTCKAYDAVEGLDERSCGIQADYTYDTNGNQISARYCKTVASDGACQAYNWREEYAYDNDQKNTKKTCSSRNNTLNTATGECI